jgi:hypothetical protein
MLSVELILQIMDNGYALVMMKMRTLRRQINNSGVECVCTVLL